MLSRSLSLVLSALFARLFVYTLLAQLPGRSLLLPSSLVSTLWGISYRMPRGRAAVSYPIGIGRPPSFLGARDVWPFFFLVWYNYSGPEILYIIVVPF